MSEDVIIKLVDVHKAFGPLKVLQGVSMELARGHTTVILGPSGTGKSVLLKHIVGLLKPDKGEVYFAGQRIDQLEAELVEPRKKMGFLFQMGALFDSMNVGDNICFPLVQHTKMTKAQRVERAGQVLRMVGMDGSQEKMPSDLSGGQRKRVALARAIVMEPDVVLYDEPTTGLDPIRADVINELILNLRNSMGMTSVVVTHDMASARKIADRLIMINDGHIVADAPVKEFDQITDEFVQRFIHGQAEKEDLDRIKAGFESR